MRSSKELNVEWDIGYAYGDILFEKNVNLIFDKYKLFFSRKEKFDGNISDKYLSKVLDIMVSCEENLVTDILIDDFIFFNGVNLIGITISKFENLFGVKADNVGITGDWDYVEYDDGDTETCYDYTDTLGAQVWAGLDEVIASISVRAIYADEELEQRVYPTKYRAMRRD